jgi:hypothetical protein
MKTAISFFGASVTAQKNSYATQFPEADYTKHIYGYGGSQLHSAGMCMIDTALKFNPKYCFIEWFTPTLKYTEEELKDYIYTIITKCLENCTVPIFLFFPKKDDASDLWENKTKQYDYIITILNTYNIPYIEVYKKLNKDLNILLRDIVHTTDVGAQEYFKIIYEEFLIIQKQERNFMFPPSTKFENIKEISINKTIKNKILLEGTGEIISIHQDVGPFSNRINLIADGEVKPYTLINPDCYYVRSTFALSGRFKTNFIIELLSEEKPKTLYKKEIDWKKVCLEGDCFPETNEMRFKTLYYIGNISAVTVDGVKL